MKASFKIPCELTFDPGTALTKAKIKMSVGEIVIFNDYETHLTQGQIEVAKQIAAAHAKSLSKWAAEVVHLPHS